jgi:hypothetical protein
LFVLWLCGHYQLVCYNTGMGQVQQSANGIMVRDERGRFLPGTMPENRISSPEHASTLARHRWDKQQRAFADGINEAIRSTGMMPAIDDQDAASMHVIGNKTATLLLDAENARGYSELLGKAVQLAGWAPDNKQQDSGLLAAAASVGAAVVAGLLSRLVELVGHDTVEGQAVEE